MLKIPKFKVGACALACLALAVAVPGSALAQSDRDDREQRDRSQRQSEAGSSDEDRSDERRAGRDEFRRDQRESGDSEAGLGVSVASDREGVRVTRVHRGSPAEEMGIEQGDRITHINGERVQSTRDFISKIRDMDPGDEIELDVRRDGDEHEFSGELESRQEALSLRDRQAGQQRWRTFYEDRGVAYFPDRRTTRGDSDLGRRLDQIERQVQQISRELEQIRFAVRDRGSQDQRQTRQSDRDWDRETTASYDEYQSDRRADTRRTGDRWEEGQYRTDQPRRVGSESSPGGQIGEERTRPGDDRFENR